MMEKVLLLAALVGFAWFFLVSVLWIVRGFRSDVSSRRLGATAKVDSRQPENKRGSRWESKDTLIILFMFVLSFYTSPGLFKFMLILTGAVLTVRGVDWFAEGFKLHIVSRMYWAAALACAFGGLTIYAGATDPFMTRSQVDPGWAGMLFIFVILSFCLGLFLKGVLEVVFSGSSSGGGNNWRNAGDRDSDPDNYIWSGNPSHDD
jgi:hypothetical protein